MVDKKIAKLMLDLLKPYKFRIVIVLVCMLMISALGVVYPLLQREIFDNGIMVADLEIVIRYTLVTLGLFVIEQLLSFIQFVHYEHINRKIPYELMYKTIDHSINLKISYHKDNHFMKTIHNVYMDIGNITQIANADLLQAFVSLFKIIGGEMRKLRKSKSIVENSVEFYMCHGCHCSCGCRCSCFLGRNSVTNNTNTRNGARNHSSSASSSHFSNNGGW